MTLPVDVWVGCFGIAFPIAVSSSIRAFRLSRRTSKRLSWFVATNRASIVLFATIFRSIATLLSSAAVWVLSVARSAERSSRRKNWWSSRPIRVWPMRCNATYRSTTVQRTSRLSGLLLLMGMKTLSALNLVRRPLAGGLLTKIRARQFRFQLRACQHLCGHMT